MNHIYKIKQENHPPPHPPAHDLNTYSSVSNKQRNSPKSDNLSPKASSLKSRTPPLPSVGIASNINPINNP